MEGATSQMQPKGQGSSQASTSTGGEDVQDRSRLTIYLGATFAIVLLIAIVATSASFIGGSEGSSEETTTTTNAAVAPTTTTVMTKTSKTTTSKTATTKTTTTKKTREAVAPLLICTMLWTYPVMIFPPDGTCKYILLDSLNAFIGTRYNNLARPIDKSTQTFFDKGNALKNTKLGYGVAHVDFQDLLDDINIPFGANNFWSLVTPENANFAVLDLNEKLLTDAELKTQLANLKKLKEFVVNANKIPMGITAIALYGKASQVCDNIVNSFKNDFMPDIFLSFAHETMYADGSDDNCRVLVPHFLDDPYTLSPQLPFGHSMRQAVELLTCVSNAKLQTRLALFVTLNGRYYKGVQGENVFDKCDMTGISEHDFNHKTTAQVCKENFINSGTRPEHLQDFDTWRLSNPNTKELYIVDDTKTLKRKLCKVKEDYKDVNYTLAVSRIAGIGEPISCMQGIFKGDYEDLLDLQYTSAVMDDPLKFPGGENYCAESSY